MHLYGERRGESGGMGYQMLLSAHHLRQALVINLSCTCSLAFLESPLSQLICAPIAIKPRNKDEREV